MALIFDFSKKCGDVTMSDGFTRCLYEGNAFFILTNEWKEGDSDMYGLYSFAADLAHAKRCAKQGIYDNVVSMTIYKDVCREWKKISTFFAEYCNGINITYKRKEEKEDA